MLSTNRREKQGQAESEGPREGTTELGDSSEREARLLQRCNAGDRAAWDTLVRMYEKSVYRFAYMLCRDRDDAEDISGHVFVRVYQNLHTFRHEASFSSWLYRIVRNTYLDMCVRPMWRSNVSLDADNGNDCGDTRARLSDMPDNAPSPETVCIRKEVAKLLAGAVKHLPAYQREVVRMYHTDGKSYEQIAEATGLSIGTVKSRLNRARAMLRERLMPYKETLTSA